jgi:hypothetical protein
MPRIPVFRRAVDWMLGSATAVLGATLGNLRLEREGRSRRRAARLATPTTAGAPGRTAGDRRARIRAEIRREREDAARLAAEA